jgi:hypothetical protein
MMTMGSLWKKTEFDGSRMTYGECIHNVVCVDQSKGIDTISPQVERYKKEVAA